ncbi:MAG: UvrD-helicase domain-containing protein, partial [Firmicutes bacterium]|nr:UvrD-helicase domain-containing protein [Bacillota bacterium]
MFIADLHIHSAYSRATSKSSEPVSLDKVARQKGLQLIGSGDFTHPAYRSELREKLIPAEEGLYTLRPDLAQPLSGALSEVPPCRFLISGEISCIYKKNDRVRKVHHVILLPSIDAADRLASALERIGNLHSDGRPILGLDSRDLLEITLDSCPEAVLIPAHIWTPHFSIFGAYSGFDTIEECFEDLTGHIHALETGLSSDPLMNFQWSALDKYTLVSNSDCHSPEKLAREANIFNCELSFSALSRALSDRKGASFAGTIEFFPEEGKYHYDGHRDCHVCTSPEETRKLDGICPVCGRRLTLGVAGRVAQLADRPYGFVPDNARPFERLIPLPEVIAACNGLASATSVKVKKLYSEMLRQLGPELTIMRSLPYDTIEPIAGACVTEGIRRIREGRVKWQPGHDGEYGRCTILSQEDIDRLSGQTFLFSGFTTEPKSAANKAKRPDASATVSTTAADKPGKKSGNPYGLSDEQWAAVVADEPEIAVIAGPGSGKTRTLISRIAYLIDRKNIQPEQITAVTFTNKAANELKQRLNDHFSDQKLTARMNVGTFHSLALSQLRRSGIDITLLDQEESAELQKEAEAEAGAAEAGLIYQQ